MSEVWQELLSKAVAESGGEIVFNEPLARHTSFRIGGPADALVIIKNRKGLDRLRKVCLEAGLRIIVLGRGTNVLISDQGIRGVVVKLEGEFSQVEVNGNRIFAGAGVLLDRIAEVAELNGLSGAEFLAGIPGTVGGGLMSNAGAFGQSLADIVQEIEVMAGDGNVRVLKRAELNAGYRQPLIPTGCWALAVVLELSKGAARKGKEIRAERWRKHPTAPSAGSFFKNPALTSAGKLIEQCGLKGLVLGKAAVSDKHANFIINLGDARFVEVYELTQIIKATVEEMTGIELDEEVRVLPDSGSTGDRR
jgi:UDP-N-acetylmuramate dehydrogenase|uniref:UDP-N-acetylenolpyruvoylglucosamine reductase n=1 Tax=candidate division WOR-3 bacterium TaxID=2052148 RepID=A0A7V3PTM7_UNCW3